MDPQGGTREKAEIGEEWLMRQKGGTSEVIQASRDGSESYRGRRLGK